MTFNHRVIRLVSLARLLTSLLTLTSLLILAPLAGTQAANAPVVAAASSLQFALGDIANRFEQETGHRVRLVFGSSGNISRQIQQGAPFELFLAADENYVELLASKKLTRDNGVVYAKGRIALAIPPGSTLEPDATLEDLRASLTDGRLFRFAIANPEHAPYGERAKQALQQQGLWEDIQSKLVIGENVSQAAQFALSPDTQGGIIAYSLARSPALEDKANYLLLPSDYHHALHQRMVLLNNSGAIAELFYQYLQQADSVTTLKSYGFDS